MKRLGVLKMAALATSMTFATVAMRAQQPAAPLAPTSAQGQTASSKSFSDEQLITATIHQAWLMSGKDEATFFDMVTRLAELSAANRGLDLPDTKEAGERFGNMVKRMAKQDTDQLLFVVVDKAVKIVGTPTKS